MDTIKKIELEFSIYCNQLASNNKIIFYFFRYITFTAEWWMYVSYGLILLLMDFDEAIDPIKVGIIAYTFHYLIYYLVKNTFKRQRPFNAYKSIKKLVIPLPSIIAVENFFLFVLFKIIREDFNIINFQDQRNLAISLLVLKFF